MPGDNTISNNQEIKGPFHGVCLCGAKVIAATNQFKCSCGRLLIFDWPTVEKKDDPNQRAK